MATKYILGLDLGKKRDPAAVAVVRWERADAAHPHTAPGAPDSSAAAVFPVVGWRPEATYSVVHVERVPLGTAYEAIVKTVCELREHPLFRPTLGAPLPPVVEDAGGVGSAVSEMFRRAGVIPVDVLTIPGVGYTRDPDGTHHVSKKRLVDVLRVLSEARPVRLRLGDRLADAPQAGARIL
jgi:hypothetical protein